MIFCIDFDNTVVVQEGRDYEDVDTPLEFMPNARAGLHSLKAAGHVLLLYSARANRALRIDPELDPLVRAGIKKVSVGWWESNKELNQARFEQMVEFVNHELSGIFDAIDDGVQGKPSADVYLDDKALRLGPGAQTWASVADMYGEPVRRSA